MSLHIDSTPEPGDARISKHTKPLGLRDEPTVRKGRIKRSTRVLRRLKAAGLLCGSIEKAKGKAAAGFRERFAAELRDGEEAPDLASALELAGRSVHRAIEELTAADDVYCAQGVRRKQLKGACVEVARWDVYPELVDVRRAIDTAFGRQEGQHLHEMKGKTQRSPEPLLTQVRGLVTTLKHPKLVLPRPIRSSSRADPEGWLRQLEPGYLKLKSMLDELEVAERREHKLREERDYELESFDIVYGEALAFVRSVFQLGGLSDRETWHLLPNVQRRRLRGKARQAREARAEGSWADSAELDATDSADDV